jgi:RNA polymerase-binding transcription factor DksA
VTTKAKTAKKKAPARTAKSAGKAPAKKKAARKRNAGVPSATAAAILGNVGGAPSAPGAFVPVKDIQEIRRDWRKFYRNLLELRERLLEQVGGLARESAEQIEGYSLHMADCGTDNFDRDFALSLLSSDKDALSEIDAALRRIVDGTYGVCELTGKKIPRARLEAIPWTRYTVEAQAQIEREGGLRQRRLPSARTVGGASERTAVVADPEAGAGKTRE